MHKYKYQSCQSHRNRSIGCRGFPPGHPNFNFLAGVSGLYFIELIHNADERVAHEGRFVHIMILSDNIERQTKHVSDENEQD
ncbi:hypothetical protein D3C73_1149090 [compost metagenome]